MSIALNTSSEPLVAGPAGASTALRTWLFTITALVFAMVIVGGATRLTGSGLSITEWQPILGVFPPLSDGAWQEAFQKYRQIPEYQLVNRGMDLAGFKAIYWWEWTHRFLGRLTGFAFLLPFAFFLARRAVPARFIPRLAALFLLGGAQGALGWFMVRSGLSDRVDVSQYRLAAHLALATAIGAYAFWLGLSLDAGPDRTRSTARLPALLLCGLIYVQIIAGGFVAGLKAGHASNTWPLMNGEVIPAGLDVYSPWYMNLLENPLAAQFAHRLLAYFAAICVAALTIAAFRRNDLRALKVPAAAMLAAVLLQIALGVATIVYGVPLAFALAHQANAMLLFGMALWTLRRASSNSFTPAYSLGAPLQA